MTSLLPIVLGAVVAVVTGLVVLVLLALAVLLVLVSLLVLDRLLERNGVDRRQAIRTASRRLRGPAATAPPTREDQAEQAPPTRTPFSTRLADRMAAGPRTGARGTTPAEPAPAEPVAEGPVPDAPTEVLPAPGASEPQPGRARRPGQGRGAVPADAAVSEPGDRDSAIERLFAPLLDDRTEPLPAPPSRPTRRRTGEG